MGSMGPWRGTHHRQLAFMSTPPTTGAMFVPNANTSWMIPWYLGRCRSGTISDKMIRLTLMILPPPRPWIARPTSIADTLGAVAQMMLPMVKRATDPRSIDCLPKASANAAVVG